MSSTTSATTKDFSVLSRKQHARYPYAEPLLHQLINLKIHTAKMDTLVVESDLWRACRSSQQAALNSSVKLADKALELLRTTSTNLPPAEMYHPSTSTPNKQLEAAKDILCRAGNVMSFIKRGGEAEGLIQEQMVSIPSLLRLFPASTTMDCWDVYQDETDFLDAVLQTNMATGLWRKASSKSDHLGEVLNMADTLIGLQAMGLEDQSPRGESEAPDTDQWWCIPTYPANCQEFFDTVYYTMAIVPRFTAEQARSMLQPGFRMLTKKDFWRSRPQADLSVLAQASSATLVSVVAPPGANPIDL